MVQFLDLVFEAFACRTRHWAFDLVIFVLLKETLCMLIWFAPADYNSVFPAGVNVAATFDKGLAYARGQALGIENRKKGVDITLGPVAGPLGRLPEGGRNWEGFRWVP